MRAICSSGTPALLSRNGRAVQMNPTYIPRGRISKLKTQGVGHRRGSPMMSAAYQLRTCPRPKSMTRPGHAISRLSSEGAELG
jgi:hypothetical protein